MHTCEVEMFVALGLMRWNEAQSGPLVLSTCSTCECVITTALLTFHCLVILLVEQCPHTTTHTHTHTHTHTAEDNGERCRDIGVRQVVLMPSARLVSLVI